MICVLHCRYRGACTQRRPGGTEAGAVARQPQLATSPCNYTQLHALLSGGTLHVLSSRLRRTSVVAQPLSIAVAQRGLQQRSRAAWWSVAPLTRHMGSFVLAMHSCEFLFSSFRCSRSITAGGLRLHANCP